MSYRDCFTLKHFKQAVRDYFRPITFLIELIRRKR